MCPQPLSFILKAIGEFGCFEHQLPILLAWLHPIKLYFLSSQPSFSMGFPRGSGVKNLPVMQELQETRVRSLGWEDPLEKGVATHSNILAWRIPWT